MNSSELMRVAGAMVARGKGILAADESGGTIKKRFDGIKLESTEEHRRTYREMLFTAPGAAESVSGVILYDETIRQKTRDGTPFPQYLTKQGIIPGIKVDLGAKPLAGFSGETITEGLDGLRERLVEYRGHGAQAQHGDLGQEGRESGAAAGRGGGHAARAAAPCPAGGAGHRVPVRRAVPDGGDAAPLAHEQARAAAVVTDLQLRPRAAGHRAQGVGR